MLKKILTNINRPVEGVDCGRLARHLSLSYAFFALNTLRYPEFSTLLVWAFVLFTKKKDLRMHTLSAAPRSGVSDQPNSDALPPKLPKLTKFIKLIEPRARRASPQGHGKSLPDAVNNTDFPPVLEGFRPNPSNRLRARRETPSWCKRSNLRYCGSI